MQIVICKHTIIVIVQLKKHKGSSPSGGTKDNTMEKILAAHNVFTAYKPKYWLGYLALPFSKCQSKKVEELYNNGVRLFDLRIRVNKGKVTACHGISVFKVSLIDILNALDKFDDTIYIRIMNEDSCGKSNTAEFLKLCALCRKIYPRFKYQIIPSKKNLANIAYNEFPSYNNHEMFWYKWRTPLFPWFYSRSNKLADTIVMESSSEDGIWWFDFI